MNGRELSSYQDNTNNITYKYNLDGIRTSKIVNGIETKYYLEGSSIIFEDRNGNMIYYIYNGDELLGFIYNSNTYYYHKNIFGDIIGILDSNYNEVVTYTYNSWGLLTNKTDTTTINLSTINPFRYRSYYYDEETNLYYLNSRYYNPEWGRFVNADAIINSNYDTISQNLFVYTSNNFINYSDNDGFSAITIGGTSLGFIGGKIAASLLAASSFAIATVVGAFILYYGYKDLTKTKSTKKSKSKSEKKDNNTILYRYGGSSPNNFTPRLTDTDGLSFSSLPPSNGKKAMVTTISAIEATGLLEVEKNGATHYSVKPKNAPVSAWISMGSSSIWTFAIRNICIKWDGEIKNERYR